MANNLYTETIHLCGVVENTLQTVKVFINFKSKNPEQQIRIQRMQEQIKINISNKQPFFIKKFCGLSTLEREYYAFHQMNHIKLSKFLLQPSFALQKESQYFEIPEKLNEQLIKKFNPSQLVAIRETLKTQGITLIQGPPGTGKTKTVLGTVSVLLQSFQSNKKDKDSIKNQMELEESINQNTHQKLTMPWLNEQYDDWRDHIFDDVLEDIDNYFSFKMYPKASETDIVKTMKRNDDHIEKAPEKILVCGPSNASVDEIIKKVLQDGLLDASGNRYQPLIVRIGENYDPSIQQVSLDGLVQQRMFEQQLKDDQDGQIKKTILKQAKIIFGTLSSSGSNLLSSLNFHFDTVIIDEAAQAVEVSTLIPLQYGCRRLILIGDPKQLPATIFSKTCEKYKYDLSLFERLQKNNLPVHLLKIQYRMHPKISKFISDTFYNSELEDYQNLMELIGTPQTYNYYAYSQLVVFHVKGYEEFIKNSYKNDIEAQLVCQIFIDLLKKCPTFNLSSIGIISPYAAQISNLQKSLRKILGCQELPVEIKTVDGFQGREKDIIIFSAVRSLFLSATEINPKKGIGFLSDVRRMNVSLSRSRQSLIVIGDINKLKGNKQWRALIEYSFKLNSCYRVDTKIMQTWFEQFDQNPLQYQITEFKKGKAKQKEEQK